MDTCGGGALGAVVLVTLVACDVTSDTLTSLVVDGDAEHGTVFVCESGALCEGGTEEWCWNGPEEELEEHLGAACHPIGAGERWWPALVGCAYRCGEPGRGANAHCGAFCPL